MEDNMTSQATRLTLLLALIAWAVVAMFPTNVMAAGDPDDDPALAPLGPVPEPPDNRITPAKTELGLLLYFDPKLSGDASLGCADCHKPSEGWATNEPICRGYPGAVHWRNCQTVVNSGYFGKLFWQGNSKSLEKQAKTAATGGVSGNGERDVMEQRLRQTPEYLKRFFEVYGTERPILNDAWGAIATFERAMLSQTDTPLDRYLKGDASALSKQAIAGLELFNGKANCIECHNGQMLSDEKYYNIGVPRPFEWEETGLNTITFRFELFAKGVHEDYYRDFKDDLGLYFTTKRKSDMGKFRTPTLRYIAYTAPYMHAGQFFTLEEVIDFYDEGGGENEMSERVGSKTPILKPLNLSDEEKEALVAFLEELSGDEIKIPLPQVPPYGVMPDVATLTQADAKRAGLEMYLIQSGQE
jgi:cytochrome c peroxidase